MAAALHGRAEKRREKRGGEKSRRLTSKCYYYDNAALSNPVSFFCPLFRTISPSYFSRTPFLPFFCTPPPLVAATLHLTLGGRGEATAAAAEEEEEETDGGS